MGQWPILTPRSVVVLRQQKTPERGLISTRVLVATGPDFGPIGALARDYTVIPATRAMACRPFIFPFPVANRYGWFGGFCRATLCHFRPDTLLAEPN
jgi:hypothetical protein